MRQQHLGGGAPCHHQQQGGDAGWLSREDTLQNCIEIYTQFMRTEKVFRKYLKERQYALRRAENVSLFR